MRPVSCSILVAATLFLEACDHTRNDAIKTEAESLKACEEVVKRGFRAIAETREKRFSGKVQEATALCRGGERAVQFRATPWVDWANYWGTGDVNSKAPEFVKQAGHLGPNGRGIDGALLDLEYQRIELIRFNLFDNNNTYEQYVKGRDGVGALALE